MIRFAVAVVFGPALLVSTVVGFAQGNPLAWGMAIGFAAPVLAAFLLVAASAKPLPRKADPAKIARLERELGMEASEQATRVWEFTETGDIRPADEQACTLGDPRRACGCPRCAAKASEAPTEPDIMESPEAEHAMLTGCTAALIPDRSVDDCPRPEGCVIAHPCRVCGADRGQACVPFLKPATFHGAPQWGRKIGP